MYRRPVVQAGLVVLGYVAAFGVALLVTKAYGVLSTNPDQQGGMFAFGESLVFLGAFAAAAVPATGAALYLLRSRLVFWTMLSAGSLILASSCLAAALSYLMPETFRSTAFLQSWALMAPLRILMAPMLGMFFLLSALFAPNGRARAFLLGATAMEGVGFALVVLVWVSSLRR